MSSPPAGPFSPSAPATLARLDWQEIEDIRCTAGRSALLFITDR